MDGVILIHLSCSHISPVGDQPVFLSIFGGDTQGQQEGGIVAVLRAQRQAKPGWDGR